LVIDDGSTDDSWQAITSFGDRVRAYRIENCGSVQACLHGLSLSQGDFVLFLDADDALYPYALSIIAEHLSAAVSKIQYQLDPINSAGEALGLPFPHLNASAKTEDHIEQIITKGFYTTPPTSGNVWRRSMFQSLGEISYDVGIDGVAYLLAPFEGRVISIAKALGRYRLHGRNISGAGSVNAERLRRDAHIFDLRLQHLKELTAGYGIGETKSRIRDRYLHSIQRRIMADVLDGRPVNGPAWIDLLKTAARERGITRSAAAILWAVCIVLLPRMLARRLIEGRMDPMKYSFLRSIVRTIIGKLRTH